MFRDEDRVRQQAVAGTYYDQCERGAAVNETTKSISESAYRNSIRRRVERTIAEFDTHVRRAGVAQRVKQIIDTHPEFAELLDLLTEL